MNTYTLVNRIIKNGKYDKEGLLNSIDIYLAFGRITPEQYEELAAKILIA